MTTATEPRTLQTRLDRIPDPARRWKVLKRTALLYLTMTEASLTVGAYRREQYAERVDRVPVPTTDAEYAALLDKLRATAVAEHEHSRFGSNNCHAGTEAFLQAFGLGTLQGSGCCDDDDEHGECDTDCEECYPPSEYRVTVTMTVQLTVRTAQGPYSVEDDVTNYLRTSVNTSRVDDVESESDVEITNVDVEEV